MYTYVPRELLFAQSIKVVTCLYSNTEDSLYQGQFRGQPASIRMQRIIPGCDENRMTEEMLIMRSLAHRQIVKLLDCFRLVAEIAEFLVVVTEFCANTVDKDMLYRQREGYFFTEDQLWTISKELISAFAYMQRCGFAHRCISPASLYLVKGSLVVGNFSSSTVSPPSEVLRSIHGQSYYHSPKITNAILNGNVVVNHNIYKSDVYSLGLTLLALARLDAPETITMSGHDLEVIQKEVGECRYSDNFKLLLLAMLEVEEEKRGDFLNFEQWTTNGSISPYVPASQMQPGQIPQPQEEQKDAEGMEKEGNGKSREGLVKDAEKQTGSATTTSSTSPVSNKPKPEAKTQSCCSLL